MFIVFNNNAQYYRSVIGALQEAEVKTSHVQPLIELSVTLRMKCLLWVTQKTVDSVLLLANKESWKLNVGDEQTTRTQLPDMFETQVSFRGAVSVF